MTADTAETFGLDPDQERGHPDVPLALDLIAGQRMNVTGDVVVDFIMGADDGNAGDAPAHDGATPEPAVVVVDPDLFARAAWMKREGERMVRNWQSGNLRIWSRPLRHGEPATVEIRDEEGVTRLEEIRYPIYAALSAAQRHEGGSDA